MARCLRGANSYREQVQQITLFDGAVGAGDSLSRPQRNHVLRDRPSCDVAQHHALAGEKYVLVVEPNRRSGHDAIANGISMRPPT